MPAGPTAEGVCAMAGIAAAVATATTRRKFHCENIGHLPFMNIARPDPTAYLLLLHSPDAFLTDNHVRRFLVPKHGVSGIFAAQVRFWPRLWASSRQRRRPLIAPQHRTNCSDSIHWQNSFPRRSITCWGTTRREIASADRAVGEPMSVICDVDLATYCGRVGNLYGQHGLSPPFELRPGCDVLSKESRAQARCTRRNRPKKPTV